MDIPNVLGEICMWLCTSTMFFYTQLCALRIVDDEDMAAAFNDGATNQDDDAQRKFIDLLSFANLTIDGPEACAAAQLFCNSWSRETKCEVPRHPLKFVQALVDALAGQGLCCIVGILYKRITLTPNSLLFSRCYCSCGFCEGWRRWN